MPKKRSPRNLGCLKKECGEKILWMTKNKKRSSKKFGDICPKNNDFRHIPEIYRLEQSFLRSKKAKKLVFRSINAEN